MASNSFLAEDSTNDPASLDPITTARAVATLATSSKLVDIVTAAEPTAPITVLTAALSPINFVRLLVAIVNDCDIVTCILSNSVAISLALFVSALMTTALVIFPSLASFLSAPVATPISLAMALTIL